VEFLQARQRAHRAIRSITILAIVGHSIVFVFTGKLGVLGPKNWAERSPCRPGRPATGVSLKIGLSDPPNGRAFLLVRPLSGSWQSTQNGN